MSFKGLKLLAVAGVGVCAASAGCTRDIPLLPQRDGGGAQESTAGARDGGHRGGGERSGQDDDGGEATDDGGEAAPEPRCGDGEVERDSEECDERGLQTVDCEASCHRPRCGDGTTNELAGESCDDGNVEPDDECDPSCVKPGTVLFEVELPAPASEIDFDAVAVYLNFCAAVVDFAGNLVVSISASGASFAVTHLYKLDPNGELLWYSELPSGCLLAVNAVGDIALPGRKWPRGDPPRLVVLSPHGTVIAGAAALLDGAETAANEYEDAVALAASPSGDWLMMVDQAHVTNTWDPAQRLLRFSSVADLLWARDTDFALASPLMVSVRDETVLFTDHPRPRVVGLDTAGEEVWSWPQDAFAIVGPLSDGSVAVVASHRDYLEVSRYGPDGTATWLRQLPPLTALQFVVDAADCLSLIGFDGTDMRVARFTADGMALRDLVLNPTDEVMSLIGADPEGRLFFWHQTGGFGAFRITKIAP